MSRLLTLIYFSLFNPSLVLAQYFQRYQYINVTLPNNAGFQDQYWWQPSVLHAPQLVRFLNPDVVILTYNCYYMKDICKNAENWFAGPRGPGAAQVYTSFSFDLNGGDNGRSDDRRTQSCPGSWKNSHTCPETDQNIVMRHDGPWPFTELDPTAGQGGAGSYLIKHVRDGQGNILRRSDVQYTCDEFPPATWVEGGIGVTLDPPATHGFASGRGETRCAAMRCGNSGVTGVKAEQNWQGATHNNLRLALKAHINLQNAANPLAHPGFDEDNDVVNFVLRMVNSVDGVAARVQTWTPNGNVVNDRQTTQAKRSDGSFKSNKDYLNWINTVTLEELAATGNFTERLVVSEEEHEMFASMPAMGMSMAGPMGAEMALDVQERSGRWGDDELDFEPVSESKRHDSGEAAASVFERASVSDLAHARKVVNEAISESAKLNKARLEHPLRNNYGSKSETIDDGSKSKRDTTDEDGEISQLLEITDEIVDAAALVSEADAVQTGTKAFKRAASKTNFWMERLKRKGTVPWGDDPKYKIFRNVRDYGAVGDGFTDDTKAIKRAMNDGRRCGKKCHGSTTKNAIVYFPSGRYRVSSTLPLPFGTQVVGDATNWPTIIASKCFLGLGVLSTNEYTGNGFGPDGQDQEWFITTGNFYRQIRNLRIDITEAPAKQRVVGIHYQVAQATSLQYVEIVAANGTSQIGVFAENGSGGVISDVTFRGGAFGLYGGTQQFTAQRLTFSGCATGVQIIWDWGWVWKSITMTDINVGFYLLREGVTEDGHVGSAMFLDSTFKNVKTAILTTPPKKYPGVGSTGITIDKVKFEDVDRAVADISGATILDASGKVDHWTIGPVYLPSRDFSLGRNLTRVYGRQSGLIDSDGAFFEKPKPQYQTRSVKDFVHTKDYGAKGDGKTDDTRAFQRALWASQGKILFVDSGSYILTGTVIVPVGTKIVGEAWSQLVASGSYFQDEKNPKVMIQVGKEGSVGDVEMQDLLFTSRGATPGLILVEWNIKASSPGAAGLWDCHVRLGGAVGTKLTPEECPAGTNGVNSRCKAASLMFHITPKASGYFENMWLWAADHMIDDDDLEDANNRMVETSVYAARGLLIESVEPTWLYGTSVEHAVFYQYNFNKARNVFAGMIQTETPYYQPKPKAPAPFKKAVGAISGDPSYNQTDTKNLKGLEEPWALVIRQSAGVAIAGAGLYSWFSCNSQSCVDKQVCQTALVLLEDNYSNVQIQNLVTIGAKDMAVRDGTAISALDNLHVKTHPHWSYISIFNVNDPADDVLYIDSSIWDMDRPAFACSPPCRVQLPAWTKATRTVNYPRITVTDGTWKTTITEAPITISKWVFEIMTVTREDGKVGKRDDLVSALIPLLATTPSWPAATFTNTAGQVESTTPAGSFPQPPVIAGSITLNPSEPWPTDPLNIDLGDDASPLLDQCHYLDIFCLSDPWRNIIPLPVPEPDDGGEEISDAVRMCPTPSSTTTTSTTKKASETAEPEPEPSPFEHGDPMQNVNDCYNSGRDEDHVRAENAMNSFCNSLTNKIKDTGIAPENFYHEGKYDFPIKNFRSATQFVISMEVNEGCEWKSSIDECKKYLLAPIDGCDCSGKNGKQGGVVSNNCLKWRIDPNSN
ncbi:pectate lyase superfamily protein-domain-containing protein [Ilyonectria sp. MPI-CAGE-AT-0026]|nr:pectate lyase superfamily protein-domain-containing protein [Ilyonectria sp. MPI-CAGE-AT-0026]